MNDRDERYIPHTQSVKRMYVRGVDSVAGDIVSRKEMLAEFNRWYSIELAEAYSEGFNAALAATEPVVEPEVEVDPFYLPGAVVHSGDYATYTRNEDGSWYGRYSAGPLYDNPSLDAVTFDAILLKGIELGHATLEGGNA